MSLTTGGGPKTMSGLTGAQSLVAIDVMKIIREGLERGPSELGIDLFGADELEAIQKVKEGLASIEEKYSQEGGISDALSQLLSGQPSTEINPELTQQTFRAGVAEPMLQLFRDEVVPEVRRGYRGFASREGKAIQKAADNMTKTLTAQLAQMIQTDEATRVQLAESAKQRQLGALGVAGAVSSIPLQSALTYGTVATDIYSRQLNEAMRQLPESSPFLQRAMEYIGQPQASIVNTPAKMTGFGTALNSISAIGNVAGSFADIGNTRANTNLTNSIRSLFGG